MVLRLSELETTPGRTGSKPVCQSEGRPVSEAPSMFDGDKPNSVSRISSGRDHLSHPDFAERPAIFIAMMRQYPEIDGPAVLLLFCLAPHGVFRAAQISSRAVSSYLAFSPLPAL
jgi:hypothetical protein